mmetsp:Transcript_31585/g.23426  ORF Transcript_31585/g.23426 Transcript_31585/m.23426 type:complete len:98 (+) Transcript_31585:50-343(+)
MNVSCFKCKPTNLNVPGQFLVTFTPPLCVWNYLFSNLELVKKPGKKEELKRNEDEVLTISPGQFSFMSDLKIKNKKGFLSCSNLCKWQFLDDDSSIL